MMCLGPVVFGHVKLVFLLDLQVGSGQLDMQIGS